MAAGGEEAVEIEMAQLLLHGKRAMVAILLSWHVIYI